MKKIFAIVVLSTIVAISAIAQPKAIGIRGIGFGALEADYEHTLGPGFIEADLGLDYLGGLGFKATGIYNYMICQPSWTSRGTWGVYAGGGLSLGGLWTVGVKNDVLENENPYYVHGLTEISFPIQAGLEYTFWFPLQLSVDMRPYFGMHVRGNKYVDSKKVTFYKNGLWGFLPTISVRYAF